MADLPIAAIVCIAVSLYLVVIIGVILLCYCLKGRGRCSGESNCCAKKEGAQTCECCITLAEACNCCKGPSLNSCLKSCCPNKKVSEEGYLVWILSCASAARQMDQLCVINAMSLAIRHKHLPSFCSSLPKWKCCRSCRRDDPETCNCLCLEIRLRSAQDKNAKDQKIPPPTISGSKVKQAWMADPPPFFHGIPMLPDPAGPDGFRIWNDQNDLQLDLGLFRNPAYPVSTHPINTNRSETSGDFVPTSTPRFHQGRTQLFIRPGVHSAGRVIAKRQSGQWPPMGRRWSTRRRSSRRIRSPGMSRSLQRRRSSRMPTNTRAFSRRHSHREHVSHLPYQEEGQGAYEVEDGKGDRHHFVREQFWRD